MSTDKIFNKGAINNPSRIYKKNSTQYHTYSIVWHVFFENTGLYFSEVSNCTVTITSKQYQIMPEMFELTAEHWFQHSA
jgi:hypothetical protein